VSAGEVFAVSKGVEHKPQAEHEVKHCSLSRAACSTQAIKGASARHRMMFGFDEWVDAS
jgi:hypothetical protein